MGKRQRRRDREAVTPRMRPDDVCVVSIGVWRDGTTTTMTWELEAHLFDKVAADLRARIGGPPQHERVFSEADMLAARPDRIFEYGVGWDNEMSLDG